MNQPDRWSRRTATLDPRVLVSPAIIHRGRSLPSEKQRSLAATLTPADTSNQRRLGGFHRPRWIRTTKSLELHMQTPVLSLLAFIDPER